MTELLPVPDTPPAPNYSASNLALRCVATDTYRENVAYLHRDWEEVRA